MILADNHQCVHGLLPSYLHPVHTRQWQPSKCSVHQPPMVNPPPPPEQNQDCACGAACRSVSVRREPQSTAQQLLSGLGHHRGIGEWLRVPPELAQEQHGGRIPRSPPAAAGARLTGPGPWPVSLSETGAFLVDRSEEPAPAAKQTPQPSRPS